MLSYNMDVEPNSQWLRTTPGAAAMAQPYHCTEAGLFYGRAHFSTARTDKQSYILFYTLVGAGLIEQGDGSLVLQAGQALLLNCRAPQSYCTAPGQSRWHHYWAHIDGAGVAAMEPILCPGKLISIPLHASETEPLLGALLEELTAESAESAVQVGLLVHRILAAMAQQALGAGEGNSNRAMIERAAATLREQYDQPLHLQALLDDAHMSKSYFLRLFRRYMGTTPYNYLLCYRITRAKELLVLTDLPIGRIARQVGFGDESNFSVRFAAMVGQSPLQYRKSSFAVRHGEP